MVETRGTSNTGGQKGQKAETYSMIPPGPLAHLARTYHYGSTKYERDNWRKGYPYSWSLDALMRHVEAFRSGVYLDDESGEPHLAHAAFHLFTLMEFVDNNLGEDDR